MTGLAMSLSTHSYRVKLYMSISSLSMCLLQTFVSSLDVLAFIVIDVVLIVCFVHLIGGFTRRLTSQVKFQPGLFPKQVGFGSGKLVS